MSEVTGKPVAESIVILFIVAPPVIRVRMNGGYSMKVSGAKICNDRIRYLSTVVTWTECGKIDTEAHIRQPEITFPASLCLLDPYTRWKETVLLCFKTVFKSSNKLS